MKIRVLLADDHQLFRDALRAMLEREATIEVVAETGDGLEVVRLARESEIDVVCMDISMPGMNGIETTRRLLAFRPDSKVIALSASADTRSIFDMLEAGASGYVTKAAASSELLRAVKAVFNGRKYLSPYAATVVTTGLPGSGGLVGSGGTTLSPRERQVLQLVAEGHTSAHISENLHIAASTVDVHRRNIMRKLNLRTIADLTKYAIREGMTAG